MNGNIKIVIGSWGSYNECNERALGSKWLDLSDYTDWEQITDELKEQGFKLDGIDEELFIQDVEGLPSGCKNWDYIITEQTKIRLKELEAKIAGLDFDIEQERQRNYTFLTPEKIESYLNAVICGDIQEMSVRKLIVKTFIREVILDNDSVTITYNFCEDYTKYKISPESIIQVIRQSVKKTAYNKNLCSYKLPPLPPSETRLNFLRSDEFSFISSRFLAFSTSFNCFLLRHLVSLSFEL